MCQRRRSRLGAAVPLVLVLLAGLASIVMGVLRYSGSEVRQVNRLIGEKKAEYLAYAGISWTLEKLRRDRWYQPPGNPPAKVQRPNSHTEVLEPFGPGNGKITVVCDEFGQMGVDVRKSDLYQNMEKADLLDHIKVYSIGEDPLTKSEAMVYGKFIMSPSPYLNSNSTDAPTMGQAAGTKGEMVVTIEKAWSQDGEEETNFIVDTVSIKVGDRVDPNKIIAHLTPGTPRAGYQITASWDLKPPFFGTVTSVKAGVGDKLTVGDVFATIKEESGSSVPSETLKRLVQVKKVDLRSLRGKKLTELATVREVGQEMARESRDLVANASRNRLVREKLPGAIAGSPLPDKVDRQTVQSLVDGLGSQPAGSYDAQGNDFILDLFQTWHPRGFQMTKDDIPAFLKGCKFNLGTRPTEPRAEIVQVLTHSGHQSVLDELYKVSTRDANRNPKPEVFLVQSIEAYLRLLPHNPEAATKQLIHDLTFLQNARKRITVTLAGGTPWEDDVYKDKLKNDPQSVAGYWWWPERKGWYGPITIDGPYPDEVPYTLENDTVDPPIRLRVDYLLDYFRKHYDEGGLQPFPSGWRLPQDQNDTPQRPGPPDSTGAKYSGCCS
ncbi:MAG: hypothetical protein GX442_20350 [Candidatus Riflebacteria bacterium]|nr:hypothetical protein [Candidatus Riflebacteria bacterium]